MSGDPSIQRPLTPAAFHILVSLMGGAMHGYAIKRVVEERTDGVVRLGAGTLYHAIRSLHKRGLVDETDSPQPYEAGSSRWRFYRITKEGQRALEAELRRLEADVQHANAKLALARQEPS